MTKLNVLATEWHGCTKCDLHKTRMGDQITFGGGAKNAKYFFVANAPSASDEETGTAFSSQGATLLLEELVEAGIDRKDCYFTYAVSCRPKVFVPRTESEDERVEDRAPNREELAACRARLYETLYQVDPRIVITLGEWATKTMIRGRLPRYIEAVGKQYICVLPAATPEDRAEGKVSGKARYFDLKYPVYAAPDPSTIFVNTSTAAHGPHAVLRNTLTRARELVQFVLSAEASAMEEL